MAVESSAGRAPSGMLGAMTRAALSIELAPELPERLRRAAVLAAATAALGVLSGLWLYGSYNGWSLHPAHPLVSLGDALGTGLMDWGLWLPAWPLASAVARRWPVRRAGLGRALAAHAVAAPLLSLLQLALFALATVAIRAWRFEQDPALSPGDIVLAALAEAFQWKFRSGVLVALLALVAFQAGAAYRSSGSHERRVRTLAQRLRAVVGRVRAARRLPVPEAAPAPAPDDTLVLEAGGRTAFLRFPEIERVEAAGNYLRVHAGGRVHLGRGTLAGLEARAAEHGFVRVHRSHLVRVAAIRALEPAGGGDLVVHLRDGTELPVSRRQRAALERLLGQR